MSLYLNGKLVGFSLPQQGGGGSANISPLGVTPTTTQQIFTPTGTVDGFGPVIVNAVTSSIDSNIQPGNIKRGCSILGVQGNYVTPTNVNVKFNFDNPIALENNFNYLIHGTYIQMYTSESDVMDPLTTENGAIRQFVNEGKFYINPYDNTISSSAQKDALVGINLGITNILVLIELTITPNCGWGGIRTGTNWVLDWEHDPVWSKPYAATTQTYVVGFYLVNGQNTFGIQYGQTDVETPEAIKISKIHAFTLPISE